MNHTLHLLFCLFTYATIATGQMPKMTNGSMTEGVDGVSSWMNGNGSVWLDEVTVQLATAQTRESQKVSRTIWEFDDPFSFSYLAFEKTATVQDGVAHIEGSKGQGGAGIVKPLDLSKFADHSPAIWLRIGPQNQAQEIRLFLSSGDDIRRTFNYRLEAAATEKFGKVLPTDSLAIDPKLSGEEALQFDAGKINALQIQGDWKSTRVDVYLDKIELVAPNEEMRAERKAYALKMAQKAERKMREEQQRQAELKRLLADAPHPEDGPEITHVCSVAPDILAVTIQDGSIEARQQYPYTAQPGDEISEKKDDSKKVLQWRNGRIIDAPKERSLLRKQPSARKETKLGDLIENDKTIAPGSVYAGVPLTLVTVDQPAAYRISSDEYARPATPSAVFVKCKPIGQANNQIPLQCTVYLKTPQPLRLGATYRIEFRGVNTRQTEVSYRHDPSRKRSEAIHVTQVGYRPTDLFKRAYLSIWLGTGGTIQYDAKKFELLDAQTHQSVFEGDVTLGFAADRNEPMRNGKNNTQANVYYLDFHKFVQPGEYRVYVPGIGVSYPFTIADNVWQRAFTASMHGFLSHRSGIALGPPFTDYERPRPMHPDDGVHVFELDVTFWHGEAASVDQSLRRLLGEQLDSSKLKKYASAWGGYMDAGDWDRRSQHLKCTLKLLELCELFPEYFEDQNLMLPISEANDLLPDVINEALWNLDCYRRLQRSDGGVGGGIESTAHPKPGEASWQESLLLGTFLPDPETSLRYAACAARAARLLGKYDRELSEEYKQSAVEAWNWAQINEQAAIEMAVAITGSRAKDPAKLREAVRRIRALAAVDLLWLTGDNSFHTTFLETSWLGTGKGDAGNELDALFVYARLPEKLGEAHLKDKAREWFEDAARTSIQFARNNAFNITCRVPQLPMIGYVAYYSAPETTIGCVLPRAHYLTGKDEYLNGALAAQFSAGANPMNMTLTTGVGHRYPKHPLHVDSRNAGIDPPVGITVYGNFDPAISDGSTDWAHTWYLHKQMIPGSRNWPAAEFYVDLGNWPPMNEYTVHQTFAPVSYYWGYLAARRDK